MKINFPNVVVSIKILTGAFAFLLFILIGALCGSSMTVLFFGGIITYAFFYVLGSVVARLLAEVNKEIEIEAQKASSTLNRTRNCRYSISGET